MLAFRYLTVPAALLFTACATTETLNVEWRSETLPACDADNYLYWTPPADERVVMASLRIDYDQGSTSYAQGVVIGPDGVMANACGGTPIVEAVVTYAVVIEDPS